MQNRLVKLSSWMEQNHIDVAMLTQPMHVRYFTGFDSNPHERVQMLLLLQGGERVLLVPELDRLMAESVVEDIRVVGYFDTENPWEKIQEIITAALDKVTVIGIEKAHVVLQRAELIEQIFPTVQFIDLTSPIQQLRLIKSQEEIVLLQEAGRLADYAFKVARKAVHEGITEQEVVAEVEYELKKIGVKEMSFSTLVLFGANAANPHGMPGARSLQNGDVVLIDLGVMFAGYASDATRTFVFGTAPAHVLTVYQTVFEAQRLAQAAARPGVSVASLDEIARSYIEKAGYGMYFTHRLGHGIGIDVHEFPTVSSQSDVILEEGMCISIEPGIYIPEVTGVRIEDCVFIHAEGAESFTHYPKELQVIK